MAVCLSCLRSSLNEELVGKGNIRRKSYLALTVDRYNVQKTPHVDWNGTRYARGMNRKLTSCAMGHTPQLVNKVGMNRSLYF
jgi:hypothetical protein